MKSKNSTQQVEIHDATLTLLPGSFSHRGEWSVYRNSDGFLELFRGRSLESGGIERRVTRATSIDELPAYFTPVAKAKKITIDPGQLRIEDAE